jgi:hypothetical protein
MRGIDPMIGGIPAGRRRGVFAVVLAAALIWTSAGCSDGPDVAVEPVGPLGSTPAVSAAPRADPVISRIGDTQWAQLVDTGTWRPGCPVGRRGLRRLDVNHIDFEGNVVRGSLIAHRDSVQDLAEVLTALFDAGFPIERIEPVELYEGDVNLSLGANNTSAFNCRRPEQINAPVRDSPHANGRAIDINPYQNPWQDLRCECWVPSADYGTQREGRGVITRGSLPWQEFTDREWIWQNIKVADYMHFDTGYPSRARRASKDRQA